MTSSPGRRPACRDSGRRSRVEQRVLPHSLDAERSVLGAILINNAVFPPAAEVVQAADFFRDGHKRLFECIDGLLARGVEADLVTVKESLERNGLLDDPVGGFAYVSALVDGVPHSTNVAHYAAIVKAKAQLRQLIFDGNRTVSAAYAEEAAPADLARAAVESLAPLQEGARNSTAAEQERLVQAEERKERARAEARRRLDAEHHGALPEPVFHALDQLLATPSPPLEYLVEGLQPLGSKVLFTAQAKAGKTTSVVNLIRSLVDGDPFLGLFNVHPRPGHVLLIDLEMSPNQLKRWFADLNIRNAGRVKVVQLRGQARSFNILDPSVRRKWADYLRRENISYPIIDNVRPVLDACGLKEQSEAGLFLNALDELMAEAGIREFMVIHHMGHAADRARGDSRLIDWPDVTWKMVRQRNAKTNEVDDPSAPRFFSAYGRDVEVAESQLSFEAERRTLTLSGGTRRESVSNAAVSTLYDLLGERLLPKSALEAEGMAAGLGRQAARDAIDTGLMSQVFQQTDGPNRSKIISRGIGSPVRHGSPLSTRPTGSPFATSLREGRTGGQELAALGSPEPTRIPAISNGGGRVSL